MPQKDTINRVKPEKLSANYISDKALISETYGGLLKLNSNNTANNLIKKWANYMNRYLSKKRKRHMKGQ